jgi:hypothetical protein
MRLVFRLALALCLVVPAWQTVTYVANPAVVLAADDKGNPDVKVWVNTDSGVYHCPNTRWYGVTKHGKYMTQIVLAKLPS